MQTKLSGMKEQPFVPFTSTACILQNTTLLSNCS